MIKIEVKGWGADPGGALRAPIRVTRFTLDLQGTRIVLTYLKEWVTCPWKTYGRVR